LTQQILEKKRIGKTDLMVSPLCFGTSGLGNMPDTYGYEVDEKRARETLNAIFDGPINFLDTSNNYGFGRSEARIGDALRERGGLPDGFVISTKVDRDMESGTFDASRTRRSLEESLTRLGLEKVQILHLHDPEHARDLKEITCQGGALEELFKIKEEGLAEAVGLAMGRLDVMESILWDWPFDALMNHNRWNVINKSADRVFTKAHERGIAILNAAPYASGVLAKGSSVMPRIAYQDATAESLEPVKAIEAICTKYQVPPGALALQFSTRDARITSTVAGVTKPSRVQQTIDWANVELPDSLWTEIENLNFSMEDPEANREYKPG
jgi:D-threo-aldose 1-dehydrogenase